MNSKRFEVKRKAATLFLAMMILLVSVAPTLAAADAGEGSSYWPDPTEYPAGMLQAEDWR